MSQGISTPLRAVTIDDSPNLDAFSRLRVSDPTTLFTVQCQYDAEPFLMESVVTGTGVAASHSAATRMVAVSCTTGTGTSIFQSHEYIPYQPGKSQLVFVTFVLGAAVASAVVNVGLFDSDNGIMFRQNGTSGLQIVRRTNTSGSPVDTAVSQSSWNLDKLDGTGSSGVTLDIEKAQILVIDAQFLGMGRVRVGFDIGGAIIYAHEFLNANSLTLPYTQTLSLPVALAMTATSTATTKTAYFKCASVSSEGGLEEDLAYQRSTPEATVTAASGAATHLLSIRPATTFNSITNRALIKPANVEILVTGTNPVLWTLSIGATWSAAPTWTAIGTGSSTEYTSTAGTLSGVGTIIASGYVSASATNRGAITSRIASRYPLTLSRAAAVRANGTLTLCVTGIGGTSASRAVLNFSEIR